VIDDHKILLDTVTEASMLLLGKTWVQSAEILPRYNFPVKLSANGEKNFNTFCKLFWKNY